jgi:hypothetical protein
VAGELENELKIVEVGSGSIWTPFYIPGAKTAFSELKTDTYTTKSGQLPNQSPS